MIRRTSAYTPDRVRLKGRLRGPFLLMSIDQPVAFSQPFIHDTSTRPVVWTFEVIRQVQGLDRRLVFRGVGTPHLRNIPIVCFFNYIPTSVPGDKCAGTVAHLVFAR
jgi:hypothetical protein